MRNQCRVFDQAVVNYLKLSSRFRSSIEQKESRTYNQQQVIRKSTLHCQQKIFIIHTSSSFVHLLLQSTIFHIHTFARFNPVGFSMKYIQKKKPAFHIFPFLASFICVKKQGRSFVIPINCLYTQKKEKRNLCLIVKTSFKNEKNMCDYDVFQCSN